jgi:hypothetical protein
MISRSRKICPHPQPPLDVSTAIETIDIKKGEGKKGSSAGGFRTKPLKHPLA